METEHELKCHPEYFGRICRGQKTFEIRKNDRDFQVGDILVLREYDPKTGWPDYGGCDQRRAKVTYITNYAQQDGYVVMGIELLDEHRPLHLRDKP